MMSTPPNPITTPLKKCPRCEKYGNPKVREAAYLKKGKSALIYTCEFCGWKVRV